MAGARDASPAAAAAAAAGDCGPWGPGGAPAGGAVCVARECGRSDRGVPELLCNGAANTDCVETPRYWIWDQSAIAHA
jgi:hypothetical protein